MLYPDRPRIKLGPTAADRLVETTGSAALLAMWILAIFNYTTQITKDNALRQYTIATKMLRYLNLLSIALFFYQVLTTISAA